MTTHLAPLERAARILCQMDNVDPDQQVAVPHPLFPSVVEQVPQWHQAAEALLNLSKMLGALNHARLEEETLKATERDPRQRDLFN